MDTINKGIMPPRHEFISDKSTRNGVEQWAVFERCGTSEWHLVARCPDEECAHTLAAHLTANVQKLLEKGFICDDTCVPVCSVDAVCASCGGAGLIERIGKDSWDDLCPNAKRIVELEKYGQ